MMTPIFQSERLWCRRWISDDFASLLKVYSDLDAMRWVGDGRPLTHSACHEWFKVTAANYAKYGYGMFTLIEPQSGLVIGFAGLVHPGGQPEAEIKYALDRAYWGRGLASEAVPQLLQYGALVHGLKHIIATVAADNLASQRVLTKAGMMLKDQYLDEDGATTLVFQWAAPGL